MQNPMQTERFRDVHAQHTSPASLPTRQVSWELPGKPQRVCHHHHHRVPLVCSSPSSIVLWSWKRFPPEECEIWTEPPWQHLHSHLTFLPHPATKPRGVGDTSGPCWALRTGKQRSGAILCAPVDGSCTHTGRSPPHPVHEGLVGAEGDPKMLPRTQACPLAEWRATQGHEVPVWRLTGLMLSSISTSHK